MGQPRRLPSLLGVALCLVTLVAVPAAAQVPQAARQIDRPLRVFIDCRAPGCDQEFFRRELSWVDHMRDQNDADIHVLVTTQVTGGGGTAYTMRFIGHGPWVGDEDALRRTTEPAASDDDRRRALAQAFALGLARFAAATPVGAQLKVAPPTSQARPAPTPSAADPWNFWVFRTSLNGFLNGEATSNFTSFNASQSANRTTEAWKINVGAGGNYSESRFELSDGETFVSARRGWNANALVVKSLTDHWSVGGRAGASRSTFLNQELAVRVAPGVEFDVFPYDQSTDRLLTVQWTTGINRFVYDEVTIFGLMDETRWDESILASLSLRQPFGTVSLTSEAAHYFDDMSRYRFALFADTDFRLTRGLSLRLDANYQVLHDQLYLRRGEATNEEIIARQRQLETSYRYFVSVGVTYRFGSINNNIVNPRFGGGPGGGFSF